MSSIEHGQNAIGHHTIWQRAARLLHRWPEYRRYAKERRAIAHLSDRMMRDVGAESHIHSKHENTLTASRFLALSHFQP